jgi:hypothetical protein
MDTNNFYKFVQQHFRYLVTDFGFIPNEINEGYGIVKFVSPKSMVVVEADRDRFAVKIKPADFPTGMYVNINWIIEYLTQKSTSDLPQLTFPTPEDQLSVLIQTYARLLKLYCSDLLNGDFSWWKDLILYVIQEMKANYRATTGMDLQPEIYQRLQEYLDE